MSKYCSSKQSRLFFTTMTMTILCSMNSVLSKYSSASSKCFRTVSAFVPQSASFSSATTASPTYSTIINNNRRTTLSKYATTTTTTTTKNWNKNQDLFTRNSTPSYRMVHNDDNSSESESGWYDDDENSVKSWMDKNIDFTKHQSSSSNNNEYSTTASGTKQRRRRNDKRAEQFGQREREERNAQRNQNFRDDFRGTRVFVQGLPDYASWQDLKDHFKVAGDVVFASVSMDTRTGQSKGCGIVQYESTDMAVNAIKIMRDHPMEGNQLYVRQDFQEERGGGGGGNRNNGNEWDGSGAARRRDGPNFNSNGGNSRMANTWRCADEENARLLPSDQRSAIESLITARDQARRRKNYTVSDNIREELKAKYQVHLDDRLKSWWYSVDNIVPKSVSDTKGDGRWNLKPWRQIPTTPENDACVSPDLVEGLLKQRDIARREKDFRTADALLEEARTSPDGDLDLRIHDESRTWRVWTLERPPTPTDHYDGGGRGGSNDGEWERQEPMSATEKCIALVEKYDPSKIDEVKNLLKKFPGREYNILKRLKQNYIS